MAATAGSGSFAEWLSKLLLVRGTSFHASCVHLVAPREEQQRNAARSDSSPKCEPSLTQRCEAGQQRVLRTGGVCVHSQAFATRTRQSKEKAIDILNLLFT